MRIRSFLRTAGLALLLFAAFVGLLYIAKLSPDAHVNVNQYAVSDVAYANGGTAHFDNKNFGRLDKDDVATLRLHLPEQPFFQSAMLRFYNYNAVTEVWLGNKLLMSYGEVFFEYGMMFV